ncbi:PIF-2 [Callinectes sapidus nudivirus]|nr:PIF-2 [Callinectes sapidus nudivirus]
MSKNEKKDEFKKNNMLKQPLEELKPKLGRVYLLFFSILIIIILIVYFVTLKVDPTEYFNYLLDSKLSAMNEKLMQLKNANTIYNLPEVSLQTNNENIENLINCKNTIKLMGPYTEDENTLKKYRNICKNTCGGSGQLIMVENLYDYVYDKEFVNPGVYCSVDPIPCNHNTGYVVATVNGTTCNSKYPRMFGGVSATDVIACNNEKNPSTGSILWDYANNEIVDPLTVQMTNEDETLPDGSYRFRCKFGETSNENPYIANPVDRFHPMADKCNDSIHRADYSVHAKITDTDWFCDCGDFSITRVKNLNEGDPKSICTSCYREIKDNKLQTPYMCFNLDSPFTATKKYAPCLEYSRPGNPCNTIEVETAAGHSTHERYLIFTKMDNIIPDEKLVTSRAVYNNG